MRQIKASKILISAERSNLTSSENLSRTWHLRESLLSVVDTSTIECIGVYKGTSETSFMVESTDSDLLRATGEYFSKLYDQDSYLLVHGDNAVELIKTGEQFGEIIGTWTLDIENSERLKDKTVIGNTTYYIQDYIEPPIEASDVQY